MSQTWACTFQFCGLRRNCFALNDFFFAVEGHSGKLVFGTVGGVECVCMKGRFPLLRGLSYMEGDFVTCF